MIDWNAITEKIGHYAEELLARLPLVIVGIIVFVILLYISKFGRKLIEAAVRRFANDPMATLVYGRIAYILFLVVSVMISLTIVVPSFSLATIVTSLGIGSVAIGFAFKDIIENFFAGMYILLNKPFRVGDTIEIGGYRGDVVNIGIRATTIRLFNRENVLMPCARLFKEEVIVVTKENVRRSQVSVRIPAETDLVKTQELFLEAVLSVPAVARDPKPIVAIEAMGDSGYMATVWFFADLSIYDSRILTADVLQAIDEARKASDISFAYPKTTFAPLPPEESK